MFSLLLLYILATYLPTQRRWLTFVPAVRRAICMAFALKASSSAPSLSHPMRRGTVAAVAVPAPGRPVVRAITAAAVTSLEPAVTVPSPAPSGWCASLSTASERGLSVAEAMSRVRANGKVSAPSVLSSVQFAACT